MLNVLVMKAPAGLLLMKSTITTSSFGMVFHSKILENRCEFQKLLNRKSLEKHYRETFSVIAAYSHHLLIGNG